MLWSVDSKEKSTTRLARSLIQSQSPEGWVSRKGPNGRLYWHHLALGPPPLGSFARTLADRQEQTTTVRAKRLPDILPVLPVPSLQRRPSTNFRWPRHAGHVAGSCERCGWRCGRFILQQSAHQWYLGSEHAMCGGSSGVRTQASDPSSLTCQRRVGCPTGARNGRMFWHHRSLGPAPWEHSRGHSYG